MPRGRPKKTNFKPSPLNITLLLVKIILIKVGNIPLWLFLSLRALAKQSHVILGTQSEAWRTPESDPGQVRITQDVNRMTIERLTRLLEHRQSRKRGRPKKFHLSKRSKIILGISTFLIFLFSYTFFLLTAAYQLPTPTRLISPNEPVTTEF